MPYFNSELTLYKLFGEPKQSAPFFYNHTVNQSYQEGQTCGKQLKKDVHSILERKMIEHNQELRAHQMKGQKVKIPNST